MTDTWIAPDEVFDGTTIRRGMALRVLDGNVVDLRHAPDGALRVVGCLTPGFVDLQVNGGGGVMLNTSPTRDGIATIAAAHRRTGTIAIMPTVITDGPDVLESCADAIMAARHDQGVIGLHIEGPHIALTRRGTHSPAYIRPLDDQTISVVNRLRRADVPVVITLAPEAATQQQISDLAATGAVVSVGHTDAAAEIVEQAIAAGASCATHLFNAMSQMTSRSPGAVGAVINSSIYTGIICDGHHVDDRMVQVALRARPMPDRTFIVSDAMATVGGPDTFYLYDQEVRLMDGRLINAEGNLAGAHFTQALGVERLVNRIGLDRASALRMAITIPANVVGLPKLAEVVGRATDDILVLSDDMAVQGSLADVMADTH